MWVARARTYFLVVLLFLFFATLSAAQSKSISIGGGSIDITLPSGEPAAFQDDLMEWVRRAADAVTTYYGRYPVKHLTLKISADDRDGVHHGVTYPENGGLIVISVGRGTTKEQLMNDWMLTHEMIHLAFPSVPRRQHWIEEGISVYVEPVARVQAGQLSVEEMWYETVRDMHQGEPESGDQGLDRTHTWGRTYWGGAMFCLMADVRIRRQTKNAKGLQDALRAIMNGGGTIAEDWEIDRALAMGDKATGTTVLMDLYHEMSDKPDPMDLDAMWKKLGITVEGKTAKFDNSAPDAGIREAITRKPSAQK
ncbi:hypothetical protein Acid345_1144 [Candidatus Koribacter versatilis Ellin345]|uniref:Peptidase M61 catalytic domain-containing protein n=1 Tax=Koribacter versatilis (strain Ellin345) TaxID=204669 RepID=Q1ISK3_KORVE|nr:hypothetical protein [Candidatus Koribacter versatilis]ABF40147.1 hypothetical protein Acid345_1144 [Candidatus Koribacter versatilis Ellin345]